MQVTLLVWSTSWRACTQRRGSPWAQVGTKQSVHGIMGCNVAVDHDKVGETFLHSLGFPASVTQFVRGHVQVRHTVY